MLFSVNGFKSLKRTISMMFGIQKLLSTKLFKQKYCRCGVAISFMQCGSTTIQMVSNFDKESRWLLRVILTSQVIHLTNMIATWILERLLKLSTQEWILLRFIHYLNNTKGEVLKNKIPVEVKHLPFSLLISANKEYGYPNYNYMYPVTGITIHMKRNDIGLLISGFYIPMASFSILSMLSYFISHESVCTKLAFN